MQPLFVLVHSPLVGPLTWKSVSKVLRQIGTETLVPKLSEDEDIQLPYWKQHAESVARTLDSVPTTRTLALVGHSGAGALLPEIGRLARQPVAVYLFVDAGLPHGGMSRLADMKAGAPEFAQELERHLAAGGRFPKWTDEELREVLPDDRTRHALLAELHPRPLSFFEEPLPDILGWPDAPCSYLKLSAAYDGAAAEDRRRGWPYREFDAGHFHMLVEPQAVADALRELVHEALQMDG